MQRNGFHMHERTITRLSPQRGEEFVPFWDCDGGLAAYSPGSGASATRPPSYPADPGARGRVRRPLRHPR
eukprot:scaffold5096_cov116-Isochrysis_galbana.AAC.2